MFGFLLPIFGRPQAIGKSHFPSTQSLSWLTCQPPLQSLGDACGCWQCPCSLLYMQSMPPESTDHASKSTGIITHDAKSLQLIHVCMCVHACMSDCACVCVCVRVCVCEREIEPCNHCCRYKQLSGPRAFEMTSQSWSLTPCQTCPTGCRPTWQRQTVGMYLQWRM